MAALPNLRSRLAYFSSPTFSGYTACLSGVELQHSHDILADLVGAVAHSLAGRFE